MFAGHQLFIHLIDRPHEPFALHSFSSFWLDVYQLRDTVFFCYFFAVFFY